MNPSLQDSVPGIFPLAAALASLVLLLIVLDLVRRRRLFERYAILWLLTALVLLVAAAVGRPALDYLSTKVLGIAYSPAAVFVIVLGFVFVLLLHFSVAVSRLSDQSKVLAQRLALLEERLREVSEHQHPERARPKPVPVATEPDEPAEEPAVPEPVHVARSAAGRRPPAS